MPSPLRWPDALLVGVASSMRTAAAPGMLALRGQITGRPRTALLLFALTELAWDKSPAATNRTDPPALAGRITAGAYGGQALAGPVGAVAGALGAGAGAYASFRARKLAARATGIADPRLGVGEDVIAYTCAAVATRPDPEPPPSGGAAGAATVTSADPTDAPPKRSFLRDAGKGLLAGLAGTALMSIAQGAEFMLTDAEPSTLPLEVAQKITKRAGRGRIRRRHRGAVNQGVHWLYGTAWGIPYGIIAASSDPGPELTGPIFGLLVWGAGLAHEPALGLAEPPWKRSLQSLGSEAFFHVVYGVGAAAALRALRGVS